MKPASRRTLIGLALYAAVGSFTNAALAADGDGLPSGAPAAAQQPQPGTQRLAAFDAREGSSPTSAMDCKEQRRAQLQSALELNVPGNPAFGRVGTP